MSRRFTIRSVRVRITVVVVVVVAAVTTLGAIASLTVLRGLLTEELADATRTRAEHIAMALRPDAPDFALAHGDEEDDVVQLVRTDGTVVASSPNARQVLPSAWQASSDFVEINDVADAEPMIVVARDLPDGLVLLVARTTESREDALRHITELLAVALPALCLIVAAMTWAMVGRALRPVEAIRETVDEISSRALDLRVPEPPGSDEITRLSRTMNRMLDRLEHAQERQRRFTSDASHELRSPVAAVRQYAEIAVAHPDRTTVTDLAHAVLGENLRVQRLVEDLLLLARADEHCLPLTMAPLDLDDLVFAEARRLRQTTALRVDTTAVSAGRINGDAGALRRVLTNLGNNATRHAASTIAFTLIETTAAVQFTIDDDGPGIPEPDRDRILQRFVRLDDARGRDSGGSGLGLAIVAELVAAHAGTLHVDTSPAGGARFRVTLPPATRELDAAQPLSQTEPNRTNQRPTTVRTFDQ